MIDIPDRMRAMVLDRQGGRPELAELPVPSPGGSEVLVKVGACGVGLTVRDKLWRIGFDNLPRIPGHEIAGSVAAVGSDVTGLVPGDRVIAFYYLHCGSCSMCKAGRQSLCTGHRRRIGEDVDGGYAEFVRLPAAALIRVGETAQLLPDSDLTVACDALATPLHVVRRLGIGSGTRVLVVGAAGGVGIHLVQLARSVGATVTGVDLGGERLEPLTALGIESLDAEEVDWSAARESSVDVAVDFVGTDDTLTRAYRTLAPGGTLVRMVTYHQITLSSIVQQLGVGERSLTGSTYCGVEDVTDAVGLLSSGTVAPVVGAVRPLDRLNELFDLIDHGELIGRAAVVC